MYSNKTDLQEVMLHMKIVSVDIFLLDGGSPGWRPIVCRVIRMKGVRLRRGISRVDTGRLPRIV